MNRRNKIFLVLGLVTLFALAFVLISASPRRRIPPGSIVLLDRSAIEQVRWVDISNTTSRVIYVAAVGRTTNAKPRAIKLILPDASGYLRLREHSIRRWDGPLDPDSRGPWIVMALEKQRGLDRFLSAANFWLRSGAWKKRPFYPFGTNTVYFAGWVDFAPELLNGSTNRVAEIH